MENITNYCDEIYEILCSLDKNTNTKPVGGINLVHT